MTWLRAWQSEGRDGLIGAGRVGRMPRLTVEQVKSVEKVLLRGARANGYATDLWTLARIAEVIEATTGVRYHQGHVWYILKSMGWSRQKPARRAIERDEKRIASWVKEDWPRIKKTPGSARHGSSSRTRAASR